MKIPIQTFSFHLSFETPEWHPVFIANTLRGAFGIHLKRIACGRSRKNCEDCLLADSCIYKYVFETPVPENSAMMKKYTSAPHPFIFCITEKNNPITAARVEVTLIGGCVEYLPYFIYAFESMGGEGLTRNKHKFTLDKVTSSSQTNAIYINGSSKLKIPLKPDTLEIPENLILDTSSTTATLTMLTPLRVKKENKFMRAFEFRPFVTSLLRRLSALAYFHCGTELNFDFRSLATLAESVETIEQEVKWVEFPRYSSRQQSKMMLGGISGEAVISGPLGPFIPILAAGERIHNGKGTSFGLGKFEVRYHE